MFRDSVKRSFSTINNELSLYQSTLPILIKASEPMTPYAHLAFESSLFRSRNTEQPTCFIRTNKSPGFVVVGKNQFAQAECNLEKMSEDGVKLIRRESGGGAVFIDEGNCMFGIVGNFKKNPDLTKSTCHKIITDAIDKTFGVKSYIYGGKQNDIYVDQFKVAGIAYSISGDQYLYHACILVDANMSCLPKYLTPHQKKLASKNIQSIAQRVTNLKTYDHTKTREDLEKNLEETFGKVWGHYESRQVSEEEALRIPEVFSKYKAMQNPSYLLTKPTEYNIKLSNKFTWGFVELYLDMKEDVLADIFVNTDTLDVKFSEKLSHALKSNIPSDTPEVQAAVAWLNEELGKLALLKNDSQALQI